MTRTMPLWGAVLSLVLGWGSLAVAQQATPVSAANDTLTTAGEEVQPTTGGEGPSTMEPDTMVVIRRHGAGEGMLYYISLGLGGAINYLPDQFADNFDPSFGIRLGGGVTRHNVRLGVTFSYNFFLSNGPTTIYPDDLNILTIFADLKFIPIGGTIRPYILACGGYYRQWIVNAEQTENVLGYGGGAGVELEIDRTRHLFIEGRYVQGQTREYSEDKANTELIPFTLGVVWIF